jgi:mono/diheme cytochrome c family protein
MLLRCSCVILLGVSVLFAQSSSRASAQGVSTDPDLVARGKYLATAADCKLCHTSSKDKPYAGGFKVDTPFGPIYTSNITPDPETGIGKWTFKDFKNAVHDGVRADAQFLYPAMPFDSYTKIEESDLKALWAYVQTLRPIKQPNKENGLSFPFDVRYNMLAWRWLYFDEGFFKPDTSKGPLWNRGAYLVQALAHCGDCHTPRNFMGAKIKSRRLQGAQVGDWYAPNITSEALKTVDKWDKARLIAFLRKGAAANSTALGSMREVVHASLSHLTENDLDAITTYLLNSTESQPAASQEQPAKPTTPLAETTQHGETLYSANCARCHKSDGSGIASMIPPLAENPVVRTARPVDVIAVILRGVPQRDDMAAMPSFAGSLSDQDIADVANYVRRSWRNDAPANATADLVAAWRSSLALPVYASNTARSFKCPTVGPETLDPNLLAALGAQVQHEAVDYAGLVDIYKANRPKASASQTLNALLAAYCPVIAASAKSDQAKSAALKRFALNISDYITSQNIKETGPEPGIIWATPAGYTLAEHIAESKPTLSCPADDGTLVPKSLVEEAKQLIGKPDLNVRADDAISQADSLATKMPAAKLANVSNALILAYCHGIVDISGADPADKQAALTRYGEQVIGALQTRAETKSQSVPNPENK